MTQQWQRISSRLTDVGGIPVARALPVKERRTIGPWCFLDHIGPTRFAPDAPGLDVGPIPMSPCRPSPGCWRGRSSTGTAWAASR